ncbi:MAG: uroporphyrinogen decarboxylase family protein [Phycisphaerae bacterium]
MKLVMQGQRPDRTPVMCQMTLGHIYKNAGIDPVEYWYTSEGAAEGFIRLAERYKFDGILVNIGGLDPEVKHQISRVTATDNGHSVTWKDGRRTFIPPDEYPRDLDSDRTNRNISIDEFSTQVIQDWAQTPVPTYYLDILNYVKERKGADLSIHGEVGTAFEILLNFLGSYESGLIALMDDPDKCLDLMTIINQKVITLARVQCQKGIDALKLSSPFAGAGFISRAWYEKFVLPFEGEVISTVHREFGIPCYIHTCGAIGDRMDLMVRTGTDGLECLDPPPLGTVDLEAAVRQIGDKVFIKGNLDSVNELTRPKNEVWKIARERIRIGRNAKGYILSSACSISPKVPPENIETLHEAAR